jgi:hypothetical protein
MTRCTNCTRITDNLDENGLCYGCRPKPPVCSCNGETHDAGCPLAKPRALVCAWDGVVIREGRGPASWGICDHCASTHFYADDQSGPAREALASALAEEREFAALDARSAARGLSVAMLIAGAFVLFVAIAYWGM